MSYVQDAAPPRFRELFHSTQHRRDLCVLAVLAWVASCDGVISDKECELLRRIAEAGDETSELGAVVKIIREGRAEDLEMACRFLRNESSRGECRLLIQLAIAMAVQDGRLTVGENLVLQFLADLFGISPRAFAKLFEAVTRRPFPAAGDPSSAEWWRRREAGVVTSAFPDALELADGQAPEIEPAAPMTREEALHVLGLDGVVTPPQVHAAYRRLAKSLHPDRFAPLGSAAVAVATAAFERLGEAQKILSV